MDSPTARVEFLVQGSAPEPYRVSFWRVGDNVKSSCTCRAGKNGLACKHRIALLDGDVTNLVSANLGDFEHLKRMLERSDVGEALRARASVPTRRRSPEELLPLKPPGRRKSVTADLLGNHLLQGGLIKGNQSYYDVYSASLEYIGSVKVRKGTVFSEKPSDYFHALPLTVRRLTDGLVWERSQSVYAAAVGTAMASTLEGGTEMSKEQKALKRALTD